MKPTTFDALVVTLMEDLQKKYTNFREPLSVAEQLAICLRFLATGDSFQTLAWCFRVGVSTVHCIVKRVCDAIWNNLCDTYLPSPTESLWQENAERFQLLWNFPNCCGAVDGKHVCIVCPPHSGTLFHNYKGSFSIVLMAVVDADYKFVAVDIGDFGSNSDGGVFRRSQLGRQLQKCEWHLPEQRPLPNDVTGKALPCVLVGDEAFPLGTHLLRPYPGRGLTEDKRIFNYRLSRARRVVENAFGILAQRWRIFHRKINMLPENAIRVVKATIILHNILQKTYPLAADNDDFVEPKQLLRLSTSHKRGSLERRGDAVKIRDAFKDYFCSSAGSVEWQNRAITYC